MSNESSSVDPVDGFDLGQFRYDAAAFIKLVIRARAKKTPDFLSEAEYQRWGLENIADEPATIEFLLVQAEQQCEKIWRNYIGPHDSGGVDPDDPIGQLKQDIAFFANWDCRLRDVVEKVQEGKRVRWQSVARWDRLSSIRDGLDRLPEPTTGESHARDDCPVRITDEKRRWVEVLGQKKRLTPARFDVVKALIKQYPGTFTKDELITVSKRGGAINVLRSLRDSDRVWESVIKMAEHTGGGYGLVKPAED
jgi:hypothetical protein